MPHRLTVVGDLFHGQVPDGAVYIGRQAPGLPRSYWHNPFTPGKTTPANWSFAGGVHVRDRGHAVALFQQLVNQSPAYRAEAVTELRGRDLACWCKPNVRCHGDVLLVIANP